MKIKSAPANRCHEPLLAYLNCKIFFLISSPVVDKTISINRNSAWQQTVVGKLKKLIGMFKFLKKMHLTPEKKFWKYIVDNKQALEKFIDSDLSDYSTFNKLTDEIRKFSNLLFAEVTKYSNGKYVLIITPDGKTEGINDTQKLFDSKPEIENWMIEKFRQPKDKIQFKYDGLEFPTSDIEIFAELNEEKDKFDIQVFIKNMNLDKQKYQTIAWLYLDNILGEFNSITKIGHVDFFNLEEGKTVQNGITILELRKLIDREIYMAK